MALLTVEGVYEDGKIELKEQPADLRKARVLVMFLPDDLSQATGALDAAQKRREAGKRLLETMRKGINFGGEKFNCEEIYEDRMRDLETRRD